MENRKKEKSKRRRSSQDREKWRSGTDCVVVAHVAHFWPLLSTHTESTSSSSSFSTSQTRTLSHRKRKMRPRVSRKWRERKKEKTREGNLLGSPIIRVTAVCRLIKRVALSVCHRRFRRPSNCGCSQIWIGPKVHTVQYVGYSIYRKRWKHLSIVSFDVPFLIETVIDDRLLFGWKLEQTSFKRWEPLLQNGNGY